MTTKTEETEDAMVEIEELAPVAEAPKPLALPIIRAAEQWAEAHGLYPEFIPAAAPFAPAGAAPLLQHNPSYWKFAATRAGMGWPIGKELTEAEFDAAVETAMTHTYR